jgi:hypothetical protein
VQQTQEVKNESRKFNLSLTSGFSTPSSSFSDNSFASNGSFVEVSGSYYFSKFGLGMSLGQITNPTDSNLSNFTNSLAFSTINNSEDWKTTYYGFGPEYYTSFNKFEAKFLIRTGIMAIKPISIKSSFNENVDVSIPIYNLTTDKTSKISYFSTALKIGYNLTQNISLFATADYLSALSNELTISEATIQDTNRNGTIDAEDLKLAIGGVATQFDITTSTIKPQTTNFGIGINYSFNNIKKKRVTTRESGYDYSHRLTRGTSTKRKKPGRTKYSNITLKRGQVKDDGNNNGTRAIDHNASRSNNTNSKVEVRGWNLKDKSTVLFINPAKEKANKEKKKRKLITVSPKNNSNFKRENDIKNFTWRLMGERIMQPKYGIQVSKVTANQKSEWMLVGQSEKTSLSLTDLFKQNSASSRVSERLRHKDRAVFTDGRYMWKVTEITTGISSNPSFFNISNCEIDFTISNEEIECLGYEGENRKFKICFDSTYSSATGDLTYLNPSSGLTVFDQTYTALSFTLVSPNLTLVTQSGASVSTVSYCFEVTVPSSVTSIGFGLQGDDLDPSPIECKPGVSELFNDLPSCLCDDCEEIELSFDDFTITPNGASGNQFNFNGNINVNVPIYGLEFQIQSYSYTATPSACVEGVSSIEESGMILMPGTTINGSTSLQLFNETASGSSSSNNNATKAIKYTSNSPLTGAIPVNLTIGLPGPISGLDPSCCTIEYTVCIKVRIFYEDGNCKSCVFTNCFQFNNQ